MAVVVLTGCAAIRCYVRGVIQGNLGSRSPGNRMHRGRAADMAARTGGAASRDAGKGRSVTVGGRAPAGSVCLHIGRVIQGYGIRPG
jgi:hypothetical protein